MAAAFHNRGLIHNTKGQLDDATNDYDEAIRLDPVNVPALYRRADAFAAKGQYDRADGPRKKHGSHVRGRSRSLCTKRTARATAGMPRVKARIASHE